MVEELHPRELTFSQAQGYEPLPEPLSLGVISNEARTKLWNALHEHVSTSASTVDYSTFIVAHWLRILQMLHVNFFVLPADEFTWSFERFIQDYKAWLLNIAPINEVTAPINKVFDLLQMVMRHPECPSSFVDATSRVFEECRLAYFVDKQAPVTIFPAATPTEGEAISNALQDIREAGLRGAEAHFREASNLINLGDWGGAVRESIHAVESVARQIDPNASKTLGQALASLERQGLQLHPALREGFSKIYGYTSDESGIRHALLNDTKANVSQDEAVFMLGACASFASYLWRKHRHLRA